MHPVVTIYNYYILNSTDTYIRREILVIVLDTLFKPRNEADYTTLLINYVHHYTSGIVFFVLLCNNN